MNKAYIKIELVSEYYYKLEKEAKYALTSKSRDLVYEVYGMAKTAYELKAITKEEFFKLNTMLIRDGINNRHAELE